MYFFNKKFNYVIHQFLFDFGGNMFFYIKSMIIQIKTYYDM